MAEGNVAREGETILFTYPFESLMSSRPNSTSASASASSAFASASSSVCASGPTASSVSVLENELEDASVGLGVREEGKSKEPPEPSDWSGSVACASPGE